MNLSLTKPIVFFDLETTGVNVAQDRIVEISILKILTNQTEILKTYLINPGVSIPESASAIHGIFDKDVKNSPFFKDIAIAGGFIIIFVNGPGRFSLDYKLKSNKTNA